MRIKFFIVILLCTCINLLAQWTKQTNGLPGSWGSTYSIDAQDSTTAVFGISSVSDWLYYTTNSGSIWKGSASVFEAIDIEIIDTNNIWHVGSGRIIKTSSSGFPQIQYYNSGVIDFMNYIEMFDINNGIAMGEKYSPPKAVFLKTTNGGSNWNVASGSDLDSMYSGDFWRRIDFVDMTVGYFVRSISGKSQKLLKTTDGGALWSETNFNKSAHIIKFYNKDIGLAYETGKVYRTTTGGAGWDEISIASASGWGNDIEFMPGDSMKVWLVTFDKVFYSSNMGNSWTQIQIDTEPITARDIIFVDDFNGWLACDGEIYHTNTGGLSDIQNEPIGIPLEYSLEQNYPNPFNPTTTIKYQIPEAGLVSLKIFDMLGKEIEEIVNQFQPAGTYSFNFDANNLASGIYFYKIEANNFVSVKKMILIK
ncbi:MAG: T9SS type A sorting domain-containing protein [Ignavibacteriales bacterium]|nr:T9SS type A sorting domain-containing protein [Ignavibacteriales bacterium]